MQPEDLARLANTQENLPSLTPEIISRARGALLASACGDALGVPYEFGPPTTDPQMIGGGLGPYDPGEWSDDTQMAICIAKVAAKGVSLTSETALDLVGQNFLDWLASGASDVGTQTREVLKAAASIRRGDVSDRLHAAADDFSARSERAAGNGALMRTTPAALAFLGSRIRTVKATKAMARLTHFDPLVDQSCILWTEAVRNAVVTGVADMRGGLELLSLEDAEYWAKIIDDAESGAFSANRNGFTVVAFQCAWHAVHSVRDLTGEDAVRQGLINAIALGTDTDTVAAIAGGLLGATWGEQAVPREWAEAVHGWPDMTGRQLADLGEAIVVQAERRS
ncbi:MAG: ADP-ribosylglycohydrolase family protein [Actinomycetaceae bacterium]|nr:ADP-ribosylglycohydrolase family protein [Actinomycetaceae bacterium]